MLACRYNQSLNKLEPLQPTIMHKITYPGLPSGYVPVQWTENSSYEGDLYKGATDIPITLAGSSDGKIEFDITASKTDWSMPSTNYTRTFFDLSSGQRLNGLWLGIDNGKLVDGVGNTTSIIGTFRVYGYMMLRSSNKATWEYYVEDEYYHTTTPAYCYKANQTAGAADISSNYMHILFGRNNTANRHTGIFQINKFKLAHPYYGTLIDIVPYKQQSGSTLKTGWYSNQTITSPVSPPFTNPVIVDIPTYNRAGGYSEPGPDQVELIPANIIRREING